MARRLADGTLVDPFTARDDLERGVLRTVSEHSFPRIRCGSCAASGSSRSSTSIPTRRRCAQMREEAASVRLVSAERIGGGLAADGMGELSRLLLGGEPRKALRLARDTGVLVALLPEFEPAIGFDQREPRTTT